MNNLWRGSLLPLDCVAVPFWGCYALERQPGLAPQ